MRPIWLQPACRPEEARLRARLEFGGVERWKEECRDARGQRLVTDLRADLVFVRLLCGRVAALCVVGSAIGLLLALASGPLLVSVIYLATPHDLRVLALTALTLVFFGIVACSGPRRRAFRIDPAAALRAE